MHLVNFSTFDQSAQKLNHKLNVIWFSPQIGDLLGTSLLAMAFLALEEMGIFTRWKWFLCRLCNKYCLELPIPCKNCIFLRRHEFGQLGAHPPQRHSSQRLDGRGEYLGFQHFAKDSTNYQSFESQVTEQVVSLLGELTTLNPHSIPWVCALQPLRPCDQMGGIITPRDQ